MSLEINVRGAALQAIHQFSVLNVSRETSIHLQEIDTVDSEI